LNGISISVRRWKIYRKKPKMSNSKSQYKIKVWTKVKEIQASEQGLETNKNTLKLNLKKHQKVYLKFLKFHIVKNCKIVNLFKTLIIRPSTLLNKLNHINSQFSFHNNNRCRLLKTKNISKNKNSLIHHLILIWNQNKRSS
jgi:hypothetical protein